MQSLNGTNGCKIYQERATDGKELAKAKKERKDKGEKDLSKEKEKEKKEKKGKEREKKEKDINAHWHESFWVHLGSATLLHGNIAKAGDISHICNSGKLEASTTTFFAEQL